MFARSGETLPHQMTTFTIVSASATYTSFCQRSMASMMVLASAVVHVVDSVMARPGWSRELRAPAPRQPPVSRSRQEAQLVVDAVKSWRVAAAQDGRAGLPEDSP